MNRLQHSFSLVILGCYFLPFFVFFFASLWLSSPAVFSLSVAAISATTLILYLLVKKREHVMQRRAPAPPASEPMPKSHPLKLGPKPISAANIIFDLAKKSLGKTPSFNLSHQKEIVDALIKEQEALKNSYEEELERTSSEKRALQSQVDSAQQLLDEREAELKKAQGESEALKTEVANLKFELFALCRIDDQIVTNKLHAQEEDTKETLPPK
ncbi:MAG: hypothetical protein JSR46_03390 [Verrucomicrobia bacterium]|nr:hypothetical protein [Verrucomicrobiota bacterium]